MRALVFDQELRLDQAHPDPAVPPGEARVRVLRAGICNTDLEIVRGYMGFRGILGHEFVGVVEGGALDGRRVTGEINAACGACATCQQGMPTHCPDRTTLGIDRRDGAFADALALPLVNLHPLPDEVSDDQAIFIEPLAAALQILHQTHISPHQRVILLGAGKLGLLAAQVVSLTGCDFTAVARHPRQRDLLTRWGLDVAAPGEVAARSADVVIDCTGTAEGFADALSLIRPRGVVHLKSTYHGVPQADLTRVVVNEVTLASSRCGPFEAAIRLLERRLVDVESLIDARYSLDDGLQAFARAGQKGTLKIILDVS